MVNQRGSLPSFLSIRGPQQSSCRRSRVLQSSCRRSGVLQSRCRSSPAHPSKLRKYNKNKINSWKTGGQCRSEPSAPITTDEPTARPEPAGYLYKLSQMFWRVLPVSLSQSEMQRCARSTRSWRSQGNVSSPPMESQDALHDQRAESYETQLSLSLSLTFCN